MAEPVLDLPIQYQTLNVDIEPVAQMRQFGADAYDVANWTATIAVNSPTEQDYELVLPFGIESGTRATISVVSATNEAFDVVAKFKKPRGKLEQFAPYLQKMGLLTAGETQLTPELKDLARGFKVAILRIPAGQHILRLHASQKLISSSSDKRAYQLVLYAPLCSFVPSGNGVNLTALVTLPPDFQSPNMQVTTRVDPMPGQPSFSDATPPAIPTQVCNNKVYAWHFRNDPKITIDYRY